MLDTSFPRALENSSMNCCRVCCRCGELKYPAILQNIYSKIHLFHHLFSMFDEFQLLEGGELVHAQQDWRSSLPGEAGRVRC